MGCNSFLNHVVYSIIPNKLTNQQRHFVDGSTVVPGSTGPWRRTLLGRVVLHAKKGHLRIPPAVSVVRCWDQDPPSLDGLMVVVMMMMMMMLAVVVVLVVAAFGH
jgi:hypothetical protein